MASALEGAQMQRFSGTCNTERLRRRFLLILGAIQRKDGGFTAGLKTAQNGLFFGSFFGWHEKSGYLSHILKSDNADNGKSRYFQLF